MKFNWFSLVFLSITCRSYELCSPTSSVHVIGNCDDLKFDLNRCTQGFTTDVPVYKCAASIASQGQKTANYSAASPEESCSLAAAPLFPKTALLPKCACNTYPYPMNDCMGSATSCFFYESSEAYRLKKQSWTCQVSIDGKKFSAEDPSSKDRACARAGQQYAQIKRTNCFCKTRQFVCNKKLVDVATYCMHYPTLELFEKKTPQYTCTLTTKGGPSSEDDSMKTSGAAACNAACSRLPPRAMAATKSSPQLETQQSSDPFNEA